MLQALCPTKNSKIVSKVYALCQFGYHSFHLSFLIFQVPNLCHLAQFKKDVWLTEFEVAFSLFVHK